MNVYSIVVAPAAEIRLRKIAAETGRRIEDLIASAAEEEALGHFRHRSDDPGRQPPPHAAGAGR